MESFQFGSRTLQFDFHRSDFTGPSYAAVCVKSHTYAKLPKKYQHKLDRLGAIYGDKKRENLQQWAFDNVQESWWEWAEETVKELLPGGIIASAGRSGGWLIVDHETKVDFEEDARQYNWCTCGYRYEEHVGDKCPFDTTSFESENQKCLESALKIRAFFDTIEKSIQTVHLDYLHELKYQIDQAWEAHRADAK